MSFICGQMLLEYAIRVGTQDLINDPTLVKLFFFTDPQVGIGPDLTPPGASSSVTEPIPTDFFQQKLAKAPRSKSETGLNDVFKNSIPRIPDINAYLKTANIKISHGYPREAADLPCLAILLGNEDEDPKYLGNRKGRLKVESKPPKEYEIVGSDYSTQYNIHIISTNYDETECWYYILRYCFAAYRDALMAYGLRSPSISFGDLEPMPEFFQSGLFAFQRVCMFACTKEEDIPIPSAGLFSTMDFTVATIPPVARATATPPPPAVPQPYPQGDGFEDPNALPGEPGDP